MAQVGGREKGREKGRERKGGREQREEWGKGGGRKGRRRNRGRTERTINNGYFYLVHIFHLLDRIFHVCHIPNTCTDSQVQMFLHHILKKKKIIACKFNNKISLRTKSHIMNSLLTFFVSFCLHVVSTYAFDALAQTLLLRHSVCTLIITLITTSFKLTLGTVGCLPTWRTNTLPRNTITTNAFFTETFFQTKLTKKSNVAI